MPANGSKKLVNQHILTGSTVNVPFYRIARTRQYVSKKDIVHVSFP